jgi:hypothetical protein
MKYLPFALIAAIVIIASCHKSHPSAPTPATTPSSISGLTGFRFRTSFDSIGRSVPMRYITWNFTGTNPIASIPSVDSDYLGYEQMSFTGSNATQITYFHGSTLSTLVQSMSVSYTPAGYIDTITLVYLPIPITGYRKIVFEYSGTHVTQVTVASSNPSALTDTVAWSTAVYYYYTYTGENISQVATNMYYSNDTIHFFPGNRHNNFAGSLPTYLLLEFILYAHINADFGSDLPMYVNTNLVDSIRYNHNPTDAIGYTIDAMGRVTKRFRVNYVSDTVYYYY